jgi:hypothetical protein
MKNLGLVLLAIALLTFAGCGGGTTPPEGGETPTGGAITIDEMKALPGIKLTQLGTTLPDFLNKDSSTNIVVITAVPKDKSTGFSVKFSDAGYTYNKADTIVVTYACIVEKPKAKVIIKQGLEIKQDMDLNPASYPDLKEGKDQTLKIAGDRLDKATDGLTFQHNADTNESNAKYYVKIQKIAKE